jgi:hypothetical protein
MTISIRGSCVSLLVKLIGTDNVYRTVPNIAPGLIPERQIDRIKVLKSVCFYCHIRNRVMPLKQTPGFLYPAVLYAV